MDLSWPGLPVLHSLPELIKLMSIELVMPSNHLVLCHSLLPLLSIRSEEHTSELQSQMYISYAVFCLTMTERFHFYFHTLPNQNVVLKISLWRNSGALNIQGFKRAQMS